MSVAGTIMWIAVTTVGLLGAWLCAGLETGVYTLDRIRLRVRAGRKPPDPSAALLLMEIGRTENLLATLLIGTSLFGYLGATGIAELLHAAGYSDGQVVALDALILTPVLLVFCEAFPKELFRLEADRLTYRLAFVLRALRLVLTVVPVVPLVRWFARAVARLLGAEGEEGLGLTGGQRVTAMLHESASAGVLSPTQATLIDRALVFHRARVAGEMVPWTAVRTVAPEWDRARLLKFLSRERFSRFPVVDGRGRVLGVLSGIDPFLRPGVPVGDLLRRPARLSPSMPVREAVILVRESPAHLGIVERDGRPVGLVSERDLVEPLTGELS